MRTSQATRELVLWALRHNVAAAKTPAKKKFAEERLAEYERELAKKWEPKKGNPFTRFEERLQHDH